MEICRAERMQQIKPSPIRKILDKAKQMQKEGRSIIHLEIGEPDFDTPQPIVKEAAHFMQAGETHYTPNRGVPELLEAISVHQKEKNDIYYNPKEEIIVTAGVAEAIFDTVFAYINPGDEVLGFTPAFINYATDVTMAGGTFIPIPLKEENGYQPDCKALEEKITHRTRMLIICNPCNPSGAVFSKDSLQQIADIAIRHNLIIISDEIYDEIIYNGAKSTSIAALPGMKERTVVMNGFSKVYAMTGWRIGYLATHQSLMGPILLVHQYLTTCLPAFTQKALAKKMQDPETKAIVEDMVHVFQTRRDILVELLRKIPQVRFRVPDGAFYLLLNISGTGLDGETFATRLLEEQGVAVVPAVAFGDDYRDYVRISYANSEEMIIEGMKRMEEFIGSL